MAARSRKGKERAVDQDGEAAPPVKKKGGKRDVAAEFQAKYSTHEDFQQNLRVREQEDARRLLSARTQASHDNFMQHFKTFYAESLKLEDPSKGLEDAEKALQEGATLPPIALLTEFLTFWAKGAVGRVKKEEAKITSDTLQRYAYYLLSAIQRSVLSTYDKQEALKLKNFVYNASRKEPKLVVALRKTKKIITLAECRQILNAAFDRLNGPFVGRTRIALQACLFWLLCYHFGPRPGCLFLLPEYAKAKGELQCLLWKDVEIQFEGLDATGNPTFSVVAASLKKKGMRNHASENLIVSARSLSPGMADFDIIIYLLAIGMDRGVFNTDVNALLGSPPSRYSQHSPFKIPIKPECLQWPLFCANLAPYRKNSGQKSQQTAKRKKTDPSEGNESKDIGSFGYDIDYTAPAKLQWATTVTREMADSLQWQGLTSYTFRRSFAETMKTQVASDYMKYLMGHRPDSRILDKRYNSDGRLQDTTAIRFGEAAQVLVPRNSVGYASGSKFSPQVQTRISTLMQEASDIKEGLLRRFGSLEAALDKEDDMDVVALMDTLALLRGDLSRSSLVKGESPEPPNFSTFPASSPALQPSIPLPDGLILPAMPLSESNHGERIDADTVNFDDWLLFPEDEVRANDPMSSAQLAASTSSSSSIQASTSTASTSAVLLEDLDRLSEEATQESQHVLVAAAISAAPGQALLRAVEVLLARLSQQRMVEGAVCEICYKADPDNIVSLGNNGQKHAYRCENELFRQSHLRCSFCNLLLPMQLDKITLINHFRSCRLQWEAQCTIRFAENDNMHFAELHQPLVLPHATFYYPLEKSHAAARIALCSLCVEADFSKIDAASKDSKKSLEQLSLPYLLTNDLETHLLTHFQLSKKKSDSSIDWKTEFDCFVVGCTERGTMLRLLCHWDASHDLHLLVDAHGKPLKKEKIPEALAGPINYYRERAEEDADDVIYVKSRKSKKASTKQPKRKKGLLDEESDEEED